MLRLPASVRIFLCTRAVDMRLSFDRLAVLAEQVLQESPYTGHLFVFVNRQADRMKILYWDRDGYALWYKRLEKGTFRVPEVEGSRVEMGWAELTMVLEGIDLSRAHRQKRYAGVPGGEGKRAGT